MEFKNMSTPASFGAQWSDDDSKYQLVNARGTGDLIFGVKRGGGQWVTVPVVEPQRFLTGIPKAWRDFEAVARAFVAAGK